MFEYIKFVSLLIAVASSFIVGCAAGPQHEVTVRSDGKGSVKIINDEPLGLNDSYSFRFIEKYRISHLWLTGPIHVRGCLYGGNSFEGQPEFGDLALEKSGIFFEKEEKIYSAYRINKSNKAYVPNKYYLSIPLEKIYGINSAGEFKGYNTFCNAFFKDSLDGISLYIVKPDTAKGTNEWIDSAKSVQVNGLNWLRKEVSIQDLNLTEARGKLALPVETWTLKIPDTSYWMMLRFSGNTGQSNKYLQGSIHYPQQHNLLLNLFHKIVESVKLEPITPMNADAIVQEGIRNEAERQRIYEARNPKLIECIGKGAVLRALDPDCPKPNSK